MAMQKTSTILAGMREIETATSIWSDHPVRTYRSHDTRDKSRGNAESSLSTGNLEYLGVIVGATDGEVLISVLNRKLTSTPAIVQTAPR